MNKIHQQVVKARRRLMMGQFFSILVWAVFAGLALALVGIAIPKIWHLSFLNDQSHRDAWNYSWILGGAVLGFIVTAVLTWMRRTSHLTAAVELDKRFGLKERLSSALALSESDRTTAAGEALIKDAESRADTLAVADEFKLQPTWKGLLPIVPLALIAGLFLVPDAKQELAKEPPPAKIDKKKVSLEVKEFKKKFEAKRKQMDAKGLKDASKDLKALSKKFDKLLDDKELSQKNTLVKLNDIKKQIEDRRKSLGDSKQFKENLNRLKDVGNGVAKKMADALAEGDFKKAKQAMKQLAKKLKDGNFNKAQAKQMAQDLNKLANAINKVAQKHEQAKKDLQKKIDKAVQEGDLDKAAKLQEKLNQKQQQDKQQQQMKQMAKKMQDCADCMNKQGKKSSQSNSKKPGENKKPGSQKGDSGQPGEGEEKPSGEGQDQESSQQALKKALEEAGQSLEEMAEQMEKLQMQMDEMEALEDLEQMAEECKDGCKGAGQGQGKQGKKPNWQDWAGGGGTGQGRRQLEKNKTGNFKARVKGKVGKGETLITGTAAGKNITGRSVTETRELIQASSTLDVDPLENQKLTKKQREHAEQYFRALRENQ